MVNFRHESEVYRDELTASRAGPGMEVIICIHSISLE